MSKYTKEHYEDVARILSNNPFIEAMCDRPECGCQLEVPAIVQDFADLFAADNPSTCFHCGLPKNTLNTCLGGKRHTALDFVGFDRERFLAACGLEGKS